jgi:hypothetical protein
MKANQAAGKVLGTLMGVLLLGIMMERNILISLKTVWKM